ncbi:ribbon-helix-helix protein, CopG family [Halorussus gelatinilyticus]|uniref:Ribbon-helix-helix protein, CopG family n=1 Tax=Halorussus gelatinilyticus TaxID=2937524 RepID=A0A8U0IJ81_9EURY|nr:ribbon-helix-helix protein, CopG family [Halorussus gelatinilyticus]UPW00731.1 ribbon-helix-helix protein, CopG family [Halorussus gelatinilyticus]
MHQDHLDMESVTLELSEEELDAIDDIAFADHRDNREAAIRELLDRWIKEREKPESEDSDPEADSGE